MIPIPYPHQPDRARRRGLDLVAFITTVEKQSRCESACARVRCRKHDATRVIHLFFEIAKKSSTRSSSYPTNLQPKVLPAAGRAAAVAVALLVVERVGPCRHQHASVLLRRSCQSRRCRADRRDEGRADVGCGRGRHTEVTYFHHCLLRC